jgi:glycosyltransferase involved in cell wall biosynthesis
VLADAVTGQIHVVGIRSPRAVFEKIERREDVKVFLLIKKVYGNIFTRIINYFLMQLKISFIIFTLRKTDEVFVFFVGGELFFFPILTIKVMRKRVILMPAGITLKVHSLRNEPFYNLASSLMGINLRLADKIIIYSRALVKDMNIEKYQHKIIISHEHFIDFTKFRIYEKINDRLSVIGYIGRLSGEKGILNMIMAIPHVLRQNNSISFIVCGEGELASKIMKFIRKEHLKGHVTLAGPIPHEDVPQYLNKMKLLVLPSYTEGLPNIVLEAMACGTPVLATPVGAIPDIVKDNETGFLLKSNDPRHIAERIIELINKPELLEKVSVNAYNFVRENFSYEKTLESWRRILRTRIEWINGSIFRHSYNYVGGECLDQYHTPIYHSMIVHGYSVKVQK